MSTPELVDILLQAADAVAEVVAEMPLERRQERCDGHPDQYLVDVLTDRAACAVLTGNGLGVYSEESGLHFPERPVRVILDPVDGSANCVKGAGPHGPSLCAVDADGPLAGVVRELRSGRVFSAHRGHGAVCDGRRLSGSGAAGLGNLALGDPSTGWAPSITTEYSGASAHDLCRVAFGTADAYIDIVNTLEVWDYLAAALVITESGGVLWERTGRPLWSAESFGPPRRLAAAGSAFLAGELETAVQQREAR